MSLDKIACLAPEMDNSNNFFLVSGFEKEITVRKAKKTKIQKKTLKKPLTKDTDDK